jgi:excisionase family DNA binding protein
VPESPPSPPPVPGPTPTSASPAVVNIRDLPPTLTVEQAAEILGCGRGLAYDLIRHNQFPCPVLRLGTRRYVIPTAGLLHVLGLTTNPQTGPTNTSGSTST